MTLETISDTDLAAEVARRQALKQSANTPQPVDSPDLTALTKVCQSYVTERMADAVDTDTEHYIFEEAMTTIFGPDVFEKLQLLSSQREMK